MWLKSHCSGQLSDRAAASPLKGKILFALSRPGSPEQPIARVFPRTELPGQASALEWRLVAGALCGLSILSYLRGGISRIADPPIWDLPYTRPCSAVELGA